MQTNSGELNNSRNDIYLAALAELETLQREIDFEQVTVRRNEQRKRIRHQTLLAGGVLLSSLMSAVAVEAIAPAPPRPLSMVEAAAIHNLVDYVALRQAATEAWITHALCTHFEVTTVDELNADDYDAAVFYLLKLAN